MAETQLVLSRVHSDRSQLSDEGVSPYCGLGAGLDFLFIFLFICSLVQRIETFVLCAI